MINYILHGVWAVILVGLVYFNTKLETNLYKVQLSIADQTQEIEVVARNVEHDMQEVNEAYEGLATKIMVLDLTTRELIRMFEFANKNKELRFGN